MSGMKKRRIDGSRAVPGTGHGMPHRALTTHPVRASGVQAAALRVVHALVMLTSRRAVLAGVPAFLVGCALAPRAGATDLLVVSQPAAPNAARVGLGFFSSSHPRPTRNFKRADDFRLSEAFRITRVRWWGLSEGRVFTDLRNFDQYTIEIYEGAGAPMGALPGTLVWSHAFDLSSLSIVPTGRASPSTGALEHVFEASLPIVPTLESDRPYLLAISARSVNPGGDAWQWQDARFLGGHGAIYSYASAAWSAFQDTDSAFEIYGRPVPAPAAPLTLVGAFTVVSRRRALASPGRMRRA